MTESTAGNIISGARLYLHVPEFGELNYRQKLMSDHVEVCVKKDDAEAIRLYEKYGFTDSGYVDEDAPDSLNLICYLQEGKK